MLIKLNNSFLQQLLLRCYIHCTLTTDNVAPLHPHTHIHTYILYVTQWPAIRVVDSYRILYTTAIFINNFFFLPHSSHQPPGVITVKCILNNGRAHLQWTFRFNAQLHIISTSECHQLGHQSHNLKFNLWTFKWIKLSLKHFFHSRICFFFLF